MTHTFTGTATDTLGASDSDGLVFTSTASAPARVVRRSLLANRINWDSAVSVAVQGPSLSDVTPETTSNTGGLPCPPNEITVSQIFSVLIPCRLTGFRIYKAPNATGTAIDVTLWSGTGTVEATTTIASWVVDGGGWYQVDFSSPVDLDIDTTYTLGVHIPSGIYAYSYWVYNGQDTVVWPIVAKTLLDFGVKTDGNASFGFGDPTIVFPTQHTATSFYIDPQVEWSDPNPGYDGGSEYFDQWTNPPSSFAFPIAVFFADPPYLADYYALGINTLAGGAVTPEYVDAMNAMGNTMDWWPYIDPLHDEVVRVQDDFPAFAAQIRGYQLDDEPDQSNPYRSPALIQSWVNFMRSRDSTKPLWLNFGIPFSVNQGYFGSPSGSSQQVQNDIWRQWAAMADVISLDQYNLADGADPYDRYGVWVYAQQVGRCREVCDDAKPVWLIIETTSQTPAQPTPDQVRKAVWAALIAGARGIVFFDHRRASDFVTEDFNAMIANAPMSAAITTLCARITSLGNELMSPDLGLVTEWTTSNSTAGPKGGTYGVPIHYTTRSTDSTFEYCFAQAIRPGATTATLTIPTWASEVVTVLDEARTVTVDGSGVLTDTFAADYSFHLYRRAL